MHLYIRVDVDGKIGAGHVMRCIALPKDGRIREAQSRLSAIVGKRRPEKANTKRRIQIR